MSTKSKPNVTNIVTGASDDAPRAVKAAAWTLTIIGLLVFLVLMKIDEQHYGGDHLALLSGVGIAIIGIRAGVVAKWQH